jgi:hypothetical protein
LLSALPFTSLPLVSPSLSLAPAALASAWVSLDESPSAVKLTSPPAWTLRLSIESTR